MSTFLTVPTPLAMVMALLFGGVWLVWLAPPAWRRPAAWVVFLAAAVLFPLSLGLVQAPWQQLVGRWVKDWVGQLRYQDLLLLTGIPMVLLSGLVQEAAKLAPIVVFRRLGAWEVNSRFALAVGAMAGAGFGVYEAQWGLTGILAGGWSWTQVQDFGVLALVGFWERFFALGFHIGVSALAAWGLARGQGWRFYFLASALHFLLNYAILFWSRGLVTSTQLEIYVAVFALSLFAAVLRLSRRTPQPVEARADVEELSGL